ncbi:HAD-IC family P-type ATPase [soil metagenome]
MTPTDPVDGLSAADVRERVAAGRTNRVPRHTSRSIWSILRANVFTLFNAIVVGSFVLLLALGQWRDALFGFSALANAVIGTVQEYRAKRTLDRLAVLTAPRATVVRDGIETEIDREEVVADDLLVIRAGDQVPADCIAVAARDLTVDESMLTGESVPVHKVPDDLLLAGSGIVAGSGRAVVSRVGEDSYAAHLAGEARTFSLVRSEIRDSINRILRWIAWALTPVMLILVNGQMQSVGGWSVALESGAWRSAIVGAAGAVIAMVPLGLVLLTSVAFAVGMARLARRQVLMNELAAVEGLARVDVICFDKTGTLTDGEFEFDAVYPVGDPDAEWWRALAGFATDDEANATARSLSRAYSGDAKEAAVASATVPFSSAWKWSARVVRPAGRNDSSGLAGTWVLGAPEIVLADQHDTESRAVLAQAGEQALAGRRVLLLARARGYLTVPIEGEVPSLPDGLRPQVILTLRERIRPDAAETVAYFRAEGVRLCIISGDDPRTVAGVARQVGIEVERGIDARELPAGGPALTAILEEHNVFGRVTPSQKRDIVHALQSAGHVIGMTGDGVNDILALKAADIGIAMGAGAPATRAVARLVLLDGRFSHLPGFVAEGRRVIANIDRVSKLFLSKTAYSVLLAVLFGALLWGYPFLPRQLSVLDGLTLGIPGFLLAFLPNARRYQPGFLRRVLTFAVPSGASVALAIVAVNVVARISGTNGDESRTSSSVVLALVALWILNVLMRPLRIRGLLLLAAMYASLVVVLVTPVFADFLLFDLPETGLLLWTLGIAAAGSLSIEFLFRAHRRREPAN